MKALVTGATGIIGNHIIRVLLEKGHDVFALSRGQTPKDNLKNLSVKIIQADILDIESLKLHFKSMDTIFHAAGYYPQSAFSKNKHVALALKGTRNVIEAFKGSGAQKLVYTSSLTTIGAPNKGLATEDIPYDLYGKDPHPYFLVKYLCENEMMTAFKNQGLPVVVVNPTGCFGPYELKPKSLCVIPHLVEEKVPGYFKGNLNVVNAQDVAKGHLLAALKGKDGQRYVLGGYNTNTKDVFNDICAVAGVKAPQKEISINLGLGMAYVSEFFAYITRTKPLFSALGLKFIQTGQHFSLDKAKQELGYEVGPMDSCYENAIAWYKKIGYC